MRNANTTVRMSLHVHRLLMGDNCYIISDLFASVSFIPREMAQHFFFPTLSLDDSLTLFTKGIETTAIRSNRRGGIGRKECCKPRCEND